MLPIEVITKSKTLFIEYLINQSDIVLSQNAIDTNYFSLRFKFYNYSLNTGNPVVNDISQQLANANISSEASKVVFEGEDFNSNSSITEPRIELLCKFYKEIDGSTRISDIYIHVTLPKSEIKTISNIILTKNPTKFKLILFPTLEMLINLSRAASAGEETYLLSINDFCLSH